MNDRGDDDKSGPIEKMIKVRIDCGDDDGQHLDDVHGRHGEAGSVHQTSDVAIKL